MPRFSEFFGLNLTQHQLDFVDVSNEEDTRVYVDPYAIEIKNDVWSSKASENIRIFFLEVLNSLREENIMRANDLMSHLHEPSETFLGVSTGKPKGRGVGSGQAKQMISAIKGSKAFKSGMLKDLSEMTLYVEGIDRDKISDLTTNIIRDRLVEYTNEQCEIFNIPCRPYNGPPLWSNDFRNWVSKTVCLPYIENDAILLVPKYIVRRKLSLDSQEFYNKQITDFLISEHIKANSSLVHVVKGLNKVRKGDVREENPKSKSFIAEFVSEHPEILELYKDIAKNFAPLIVFNDDQPSVGTICARLASLFSHVPVGRSAADIYHQLILGSLTALFYPSLIQPHKEWDIHDGRKRVDIVYTNAADVGFFSHRRDDATINANAIIVECKNYSEDIANQELDQLIGRFDYNRGKFGIMTCRNIDKPDVLLKRCRDAAVRSQGYIIVLTDKDIIEMLEAKAQMNDAFVEATLHRRFRELLA